jgi:hypothetical protein
LVGPATKLGTIYEIRKLDTLAQEALALNQLYKSISLEMKSKCIDKECETVATAVDIVEKHEAIGFLTVMNLPG